MSGQLVVPELYCPYSEEVNQHADAVTDHVYRWLTEQRLVGGPVDLKRFRESDLGNFSGRVNPFARYDELALVADWYMWLFLLTITATSPISGWTPRGSFVCANSSRGFWRIRSLRHP